MGFMKLDESILYSTIWDASWEELKVFLSCCLVARQPWNRDRSDTGRTPGASTARRTRDRVEDAGLWWSQGCPG